MPINHTKKAVKAYATHLMRPVPNIVAEVLFLFIAGLLVWAIFIGGEAKETSRETRQIVTNNHKTVTETSKIQKIGVPAQHCLLSLFRDVKPAFDKAPHSKASIDLRNFLLWVQKLPGGKCEPPK